MARIDYKSDKSRGLEEVEGSDGRLNVSARSDIRGYYNSRDEGQTYTLHWDDTAADAADFVVVWKNVRQDGKTLIISSVGINCALLSVVQLVFVSGTATGGSILTPTNLNKSAPHATPDGTSRGNAALANLSEISIIDAVNLQVGGHEEMRLFDRVQLGQNDAVAIKYATGSQGRCFGVMFGFYE